MNRSVFELYLDAYTPHHLSPPGDSSKAASKSWGRASTVECKKKKKKKWRKSSCKLKGQLNWLNFFFSLYSGVLPFEKRGKRMSPSLHRRSSVAPHAHNRKKSEKEEIQPVEEKVVQA